MEITCPLYGINFDHNDRNWYLYHQNCNQAEKRPQYPNQYGHDFGEMRVPQVENLAPSSDRCRQATGSAYPPFLNSEEAARFPNRWEFEEGKKSNEIDSVKYGGPGFVWVSQPKNQMHEYMCICSNDLLI